MENRKRKAVRVLILVGMAVCLFPIGQAYGQSVQNRVHQDSLKEMAAETNVEYPAPNVSAPKGDNLSVRTQQGIQGSGSEQTKGRPVMLRRYADLHEENKDLAGWLSIEGMKIDYPVMQGEDDEYYLHHDFYGEDSKYGCLYVKTQADLNTGTNFIIYGHNM